MDSGASGHSTNCLDDAIEIRESGSASIGHSGSATKTSKTISIPGMFVQKDGTRGMRATLTDVSYCENHNFNLLSLTRLLVSGWEVVSGDATGITLGHKEKGLSIVADIVIPTAKGAIMACRFIRSEASEVSAVSTGAKTKMSVAKAHELLGHGCEADNRAPAKQLDWDLTRGSFGVCMHCAQAKAKQKNVCKASESPKATTPGGRVYVDLSKVTVPMAEGGEYTIAQK